MENIKELKNTELEHVTGGAFPSPELRPNDDTNYDRPQEPVRRGKNGNPSLGLWDEASSGLIEEPAAGANLTLKFTNPDDYIIIVP